MKLNTNGVLDYAQESILSETNSNAMPESADASESSHFLDLPPELRDHIYSMISLDAVTEHISHYHPPEFLAVCRQIRSEFSSYYYSDKVMTAEIWEPNSSEWKSIRDPSILRGILNNEAGYLYGSSFNEAEARLTVENAPKYADDNLCGVISFVRDPPGCARFIWADLSARQRLGRSQPDSARWDRFGLKGRTEEERIKQGQLGRNIF